MSKDSKTNPSFNLKNFLAGEEYQKLSDKMSNEINSSRVIIDRSVFKKTDYEKEQIKLAKQNSAVPFRNEILISFWSAPANW